MNNLYPSVVGNCECIHCGLRGSSKNVMIRSIFPIWPEMPLDLTYYLESLERSITLYRSEKGIPYVGINSENTNFLLEEKDISTDNQALAYVLAKITYRLSLARLTQEELFAVYTILFCPHEWKQDDGTASV